MLASRLPARVVSSLGPSLPISLRPLSTVDTTAPFSALRTNYASLPRLPVPALSDTLHRYTQSAEALLPPGGGDSLAFTSHLACVSDFARSCGPLLQGKLLALEGARESSGEYPFSYKEHHWDDMYVRAKRAQSRAAKKDHRRPSRLRQKRVTRGAGGGVCGRSGQARGLEGA
jgi:hypothetical protein